MAYTPSNARHLYESRINAIFATLQQQHPSAWAKCKAPHDDGEFCHRLAWACSKAGIPAYRNGKRGSLTDISKDVLAFENSTGCQDKSGRFAGLELVDVIGAHESPAASAAWIDVTQDTINAGAAGAAIVPTDPGGSAPPVNPPVPPMPPAFPTYEAIGGDAAFDKAAGVLFSDYARRPEAPNAGMGRWLGRLAYRQITGQTADQALAAVRPEWLAALGIPAA